MPRYVQQGLGLVGFGLLLTFVGLVWAANLFGVADEHARRIARSSFRRELPVEEATRDRAILLGRYVAGVGFMLFGLVFIVSGVLYLLSPPAD